MTNPRQSPTREFRVQLSEETHYRLRMLKLMAFDRESYAQILTRLINEEVVRRGGESQMLFEYRNKRHSGG